MRLHIWRNPGFLLLLAPALLQAVAIGQIDTFEDGTTQGWRVSLIGSPHPFPPENIATGGPAGAGDAYLQLTAIGGDGAGSRMSAFNLFAQWAGDYLAAGVSLIRMDVNNFGPDDLYLRLLIADPGPMSPPTNVAFSKDPVFVPAGSGWVSALFPIGPGDLLAETGTITDALTNATELRIFHNDEAAFPGPPIGPPAVNAVLGLDNIEAVVPESSSLLLMALGGLLISVKGIRSRR